MVLVVLRSENDFYYERKQKKCVLYVSNYETHHKEYD